MMKYGSLQAEVVGTKHNGEIHGTPLVTLLFIYLNDLQL